MGNYGKKRIDPGRIDKKSISDMVWGKSTQGTIPRAVKETNTTGTTHMQTVSREESAVWTDSHEAGRFHSIPAKARKSLHIDAELHRRLSSLVWATGRSDVTMEGLLNYILTQHLKEYKDVLDVICRKG